MFSLRNNDDLAPFKTPLRNENYWAAIYRFSRYGPAFGSVDLHIADNAGSNTRSYTNFGNVYQVPPGYVYTFGAPNTHFTPSQIEVLYVN